MLILRGTAIETIYDDKGNPVTEFLLDTSAGNYGVQVQIGKWHALKAITPCVIMEAKNEAYAPVAQEDLLLI